MSNRKVNKLILVIIFLLVMFVPNVTLAGTCTSSTIGGGGSSWSPSRGGGGCSTPRCWAWGSSNQQIGVRFQIYKVTSKDSISLIGNGVDVWAKDTFYEGKYSNPSKNNLYQKTHDCAGYNSDSDFTSKNFSYFSKNAKQYVDTGHIYKDSTISAKFENGSLNSWALVYEDNEPKSGWLATNLLFKLQNLKKDDNKKEIKDLFGLNDNQIKDMQKNVNDYYITAEILFVMYAHYGDYKIYGTVSEMSHFFGASDVLNALAIEKDVAKYNAGKVVNGNSSGYVNKVSKLDGGDYCARVDASPLCNKGQKPNVCSGGYGYAVWNLAVVCEECGGETCDDVCSDQGTVEGSPARMACAVPWCKTNEKDNVEGCIRECNEVKDDEGCEKDSGKTCDYYKSDKNKVTKEHTCTTSTGKTDKGSTITAQAKICYDEKNKLAGDNTVGSTYKYDGREYSKKIYYKVVCEEDMDIKELPNIQTLYLSESNTAKLSYAFRVEYTNSCTLYWKTKDKKWVPSTTYNAVKDQTLLKKELDDITNAKNNAINECKQLTDAEDKQVRIDQADLDSNCNAKSFDCDVPTSINGSYNSIYCDLKKTITNAQTRFNNLVAYTGTRLSEPEALDVSLSFKKYDYDTKENKREEELQMFPVLCTPEIKTTGEAEDEIICMVMGKAEKGTKNITYKSKTYTCQGIGGETKDSGTGTKVYKETVIYAIPSSYIEGQTENAGKIYHEKTDCNTSGKGLCKEYKYEYLFDLYNGEDIKEYAAYVNNIKNKIEVSIKGGLCDQFNITEKCDYKFETSYCEACKDYTEGTEAYNTCYETKCGCEARCAGNRLCKNLYCPQFCELPGCNWTEVADTCTQCNKCLNIDPNSKEYARCWYDSCCSDQANGDCWELNKCCYGKCDSMYGSGKDRQTCYRRCKNEYDICVKPKPDALYRDITISNPFPDRAATANSIGLNWKDKSEYITLANDLKSGYYDKTNGVDDEFEYSIKVSSDDLEKLKDQFNNSNYKEYLKTTNYTSKINKDAYCSKFVYETIRKYTEFGSGTTNCLP